MYRGRERVVKPASQIPCIQKGGTLYLQGHYHTSVSLQSYSLLQSQAVRKPAPEDRRGLLEDLISVTLYREAQWEVRQEVSHEA